MNNEDIKKWAIQYCLGRDDTLVYDEISGDADELSNAVISIAASYGPKFEWTLMADDEPSGKYDHVDCYITLKSSPKCIEEYPWNTHHKCFDGKDYDDHAFSAEDVLYWIKKPDLHFPDLPTQE